MHLKDRMDAFRACRRSSGFSLVEVVVASGLLLMTITVVTFCVTSTSASGARLQAVMDADRAVRLVAERLAAVPFYRSDSDASGTSDTEVDDLLGVAFPHADVTRNTPNAHYVRFEGEEAPAGSFVTVFAEGGVDVLCVARFLCAEDGPPLGPAAVEGWALAEGDQPPGCALALELTATSQETLRSAGFTRAALTMALVRPMPSTAGPT